jgi:hypothetical protein
VSDQEVINGPIVTAIPNSYLTRVRYFVPFTGQVVAVILPGDVPDKVLMDRLCGPRHIYPHRDRPTLPSQYPRIVLKAPKQRPRHFIVGNDYYEFRVEQEAP